MCDVTKFSACFKVSISDVKGLKGREWGSCVSPASWGWFSPTLRRGFLKLNSILSSCRVKDLEAVQHAGCSTKLWTLLISKTICRKVSVCMLVWRNVGWFHQHDKHYTLHPKIYILHVGSPTATAPYILMQEHLPYSWRSGVIWSRKHVLHSCSNNSCCKIK